MREVVLPKRELPMSLLASRSWLARAECSRYDTELFFSVDELDRQSAIQLCKRCEVQSNCLAYAISHPEVLGVWGATSPEERERMRRAAS